MSAYKNVFHKITRALLVLSIVYPALLKSQPDYSSAEIHQSLKKLEVLGSALYIAAHPDDENTAVLTHLSKGRLVRTAYLSLTRGDGGQNLLGKEQGPLLGIIRTQELLAARRLDGADQFFTRAVDFGYSKTAKETLTKWNRDEILSDIVRVIRQFRPDVILTRFSDRNGGHGHHLASAMLAEEAFFAAADPKRFTDQLSTLKPWQATRLLWNTWIPGKRAISVDVGMYNPVIGLSFTEIAAAGRSMHKSQGFGAASGRGSQQTFFDYTAGDSAKSGLFDGIDLSWDRVKGGSKIKKIISGIIQEYNPEHPENIIPALLKVYNELDRIDNDFWVKIKKDEIKNLVRMCSGLWLEAIVWEEGIAPGSELMVRIQAVNRSNIPMVLEKTGTTYGIKDTVLNTSLAAMQPLSLKQMVRIPDNAPYSQPYWLIHPNDGNMFTVNENKKIGKPENSAALSTRFNIKIDNSVLQYEIPVRHRKVDAVEGEQYRPFVIRPELSLQIAHPTYVFSDDKPHQVRVTLAAKCANLQGELFAILPDGWSVDPKSIPFDLKENGDKKTITLQVFPQSNAKSADLFVKARIGNREFSDHIIEIDYPHIPFQTVLQPAKTRLIKLDVKIEPRKIAYIMGSGDKIPEAISQLGYNVKLLSDDDIMNADLSVFDVIVCGIRAFNTRDILGIQQKRLIEFMENGGTWIVQHNTRFGNKVAQIGPYPFRATGRDRISEEDADIQILMPEHAVLNFPNKISAKDFDGWVQERGLYFAESWEGKLYPLLAGHDNGEPSKLGGLLYANYGKGVFIYTAYSWFRQLPAGVPGAYRLFVNLISAKGKP